jgi:hypothetical protein
MSGINLQVKYTGALLKDVSNDFPVHVVCGCNGTVRAKSNSFVIAEEFGVVVAPSSL